MGNLLQNECSSQDKEEFKGQSSSKLEIKGQHSNQSAQWSLLVNSSRDLMYIRSRPNFKCRNQSANDRRDSLTEGDLSMNCIAGLNRLQMGDQTCAATELNSTYLALFTHALFIHQHFSSKQNEQVANNKWEACAVNRIPDHMLTAGGHLDSSIDSLMYFRLLLYITHSVQHSRSFITWTYPVTQISHLTYSHAPFTHSIHTFRSLTHTISLLLYSHFSSTTFLYSSQ